MKAAQWQTLRGKMDDEEPGESNAVMFTGKHYCDSWGKVQDWSREKEGLRDYDYCMKRATDARWKLTLQASQV